MKSIGRVANRDDVRAGLRRCSKCGASKAIDQFYTNKNSRYQSGRIGRWCKQCRCADEARRRADPKLVSQFHDKYETDMDFRARELLRAVQKRCRREGFAFDLDVEWLASRLRERCELTGLPFDMSVRSRRPGPFTPSIDRVVPGGGYTKGNCRVVLWVVNALLKDVTLETLLPIAEALVRRHSKSEAA